MDYERIQAIEELLTDQADLTELEAAFSDLMEMLKNSVEAEVVDLIADVVNAIRDTENFGGLE